MDTLVIAEKNKRLEFKLYEGSLSCKKMGALDRKVYNLWRQQRKACYNQYCSKYPDFGAKGIHVGYGSREFIGWYKGFSKKHNIKDPIIKILDNNKDIDFNNITLVEKEEYLRDNTNKFYLLYKRRKIGIIDHSSGEVLAFCNSLKEANELTGENMTVISFRLNGNVTKVKRVFHYKHLD